MRWEIKEGLYCSSFCLFHLKGCPVSKKGDRDSLRSEGSDTRKDLACDQPKNQSNKREIISFDHKQELEKKEKKKKRESVKRGIVPSRSSRETPPPVETWLTLLVVLYFLQQVAVSPPPMIVTAPFSEASTTASMTALVPAWKLSHSKTPTGLFFDHKDGRKV